MNITRKSLERAMATWKKRKTKFSTVTKPRPIRYQEKTPKSFTFVRERKFGRSGTVQPYKWLTRRMGSNGKREKGKNVFCPPKKKGKSVEEGRGGKKR